MHKKKIKIEHFRKIITYIFFFQCYLLFNNKLFSDENIMFSCRINNNDSTLFVVKNNNCFIRKIVGRRFEYELPTDGCYKLINNINICVKDGLILSINGNFNNVFGDKKIKTDSFVDEFFSEKNINCNLAKFDIINKILVKKEKINGFGMQIYLPDYYSVLRLYLYKYDDNVLKSFVISDRNDVGCSPFHDYKIYKQEIDYKNQKKNKKKIIKANTEKEYLKKISTESYKKMLLKNFIYIQPASSIYDTEKIVLSIKDDIVLDANVVSLELEWKNIGFNDIFTTEFINQNNHN